MEEAPLRQLVDQIEQKQSLSPLVRQAFLSVPRLRFVPKHYAQQGQSLRWTHMETNARTVYEDRALVTQVDARGMPSSSASQPSLMAAMLEALSIEPGQHVLEIGTGTGYNAALLSYLVGPSGQVVTIDIDNQLVEEARQHLQSAGYANVQVACGNGIHGYVHAEPYDHIIVTGGFPIVSRAWLHQLVPSGKLVGNLLCPLSNGLVTLIKLVDETAVGRFLPSTNTAFLQLRHRIEELQPIAPVNFTLYEEQSLLVEKIVQEPQAVAVLTALSNPLFLFYLQWQHPTLKIRTKWGSPQALCPTANYLLDETSLTSLAYPTQLASYQVRGQYNLWECVQKAYQQWMVLQCPQLDTYQLEIQAQGQHIIALGPQRWMLRTN